MKIIHSSDSHISTVMVYSEVPNRRADRNKRAGLEKSATLLAYLLSKLINEQGGIFRLLHEQARKGFRPPSARWGFH